MLLQRVIFECLGWRNVLVCNSCALCVCCFANDEKSRWNGTFFREIECSERTLSRSSCTGMRLHGDTNIHHCQTPQDVFSLDDCRLSLLLDRLERSRWWPATKTSKFLGSFIRANITHRYKKRKKKKDLASDHCILDTQVPVRETEPCNFLVA